MYQRDTSNINTKKKTFNNPKFYVLVLEEKRENFLSFFFSHFYVFCSLASGSWSTWSEFGPCSTFCVKDRQRFCTSGDVDKDCRGADQYGVELEQVQCSDKECHGLLQSHCCPILWPQYPM